MDDAGRPPPHAPVAVTASASASATAAPAPPQPSATAAVDRSSPDPDALYEEGMWQQMAMDSGATMQPGSYPERPGEPDCTYYLRTGLCRFGMSCRFNHPPDRNLAIASARMKGEYPERAGQPECQYYLKTGTCKFGPTCKFHHPREKAGIAGRVQLNTSGYPLRPNEKECAYYLKTGHCKYANTCKFHHPELFNVVPSSRGSPIYTSVHSSASAGPQSYTGTMPSWAFPRASFIPSPRWQSPSNYAPMIVPQGLVQMQSWNSYTGEELCKFYSRYGICKFGANCKFDHPTVVAPMVYAYGFSASASPASASTNVPMARRLLGSPPGSGYTS
ncbi:Zinc finger CCCH domain-containing protein 33 [Zea mays]|uniref:Zinc finger CCCH domain-containing protein 33 n=2 Tax=Zea mays TaxID=4577 RepID=A0A1D6N383_MAIZE|nr:Zinc finger CCCH domain-containing protein 33 [Zea mays]